jgi:RNA polymerase sigma factor for flagellar operon FliA
MAATRRLKATQAGSTRASTSKQPAAAKSTPARAARALKLVATAEPKPAEDEGNAAGAISAAAAEPEPEVVDLFSDEHLTKIIKDYMPLVRHAVNRIAVGSTNGGILQYEDMVSYGVQGLIEAWYAFDPNKGAKFSTYALPRIRGSILDAIRATHPLPRSLQKFGSDLEKATAALHASLNRAPTRDELAKYMGVDPKDFMASLRTSNVRVVSLDSLADTAANGNSEKLWEMADDDPNIDPDSVAEETMVRAKLAQAVELLPERERVIVRLYYMKAQSLKSIGVALGISESRASQLRHRAIRRLRMVLTQELADAA